MIWGERDALVPIAHGHAYAEALPRARLETIEAAGHYPYLEATESFLRVVEAFLATL